ncbi:uncharacterized protein I303_107702 [Kwoniella dejecticola CBS 10117]|uniref:non-specific serine/threonine protein kinase n=1 Tax=Kwoniella dejecticola CBS 10117 TaxID=1296121 RepID=A0A1A5ZVG7_9TREE|nr:CDC7 protein kinase [Kwoniella dejecticola CBS 10117]OBR81799.1 CDC7 protein kinase [Kwoniella dejecticola CBS 10117]
MYSASVSSRPTSKLTAWPLEAEEIEPEASSSRIVHPQQSSRSTTTTTTSFPSRGVKRQTTDDDQTTKSTSTSTTTSPKRSRQRPRIQRELTPVDDSTPTLNDGTESCQFLNASGPPSNYPTTAVAGPSSYTQDQISLEDEEIEESKSVLFSEQAANSKTEDPEEGEENDGDAYDEEGDDTIIHPDELYMEDPSIGNCINRERGTEEVQETDWIEEEAMSGLRDENFVIIDEPASHSLQTTVDLRSVMPPPKSGTSHMKSKSTSSNSASGPPSNTYVNTNTSKSTIDTMTRVIEGSSKKSLNCNQSFVELNEEAFSDNLEYNEEEEGEEEGTSSPGSYHSGDSDDYEMDHRPVLERTAIKRDIRSFTESVKLLREGIDGYLPFRVVDRLGEGTFSSVYLAHDCLNRTYANEYWSGIPDDQDHDSSDERPKIKVALKKILVTSSPARIENELAILEALRGCRNVSQLISAFREEDQIIIVLPYHQSDDFRHFYRHMDPPHIRSYLQSLFRALKDVHRRGIVHRDVKPANFLYDYETGDGVLVDFGLAERYTPPRRPTCQHAPGTLASLQGSKVKTSETSIVEQAVYDARKRSRQGEGRIGFLHEDKRPAIKTNRAGTRGFRAPEVLLKCPDQTVAIDIWSVGVMLLSILTHKFPVFNSSDDIEALMEIAAIFGRAAMERCALLHNRTIISNVPTLDSHPSSLASLVLKLNPHIYTPHMTSPTPEDARAHIEAVDQAIDLCQKLLRLDATKRLTAAQALRHPFLAPREGEEDEEGGRDELINPEDGKCGELHELADGRHRIYLHPDMRDLAFGQGIPPAKDSLCPEHQHYQDRFQINPLVTRRWVNQAAEDDSQADQEEAAEYSEGEFIVEPPVTIHHTYNNGIGNGNRPLKERDINAQTQTHLQTQVRHGSTLNGKRRGATML